MTWTSERPTVPGWYWYKPRWGGCEVVLLWNRECIKDGQLWIARAGTPNAERLEGDTYFGDAKWSGPIEPPA